MNRSNGRDGWITGSSLTYLRVKNPYAEGFSIDTYEWKGMGIQL